MSTFQKHFGLKSREESYLFKELEKVRQETKKNFLQFKQKLASNLTLDEGPVHYPRPARPRERRCGSFTRRRRTSAKVPATAAGVFLQAALQGIVRPPGPSGAIAPWTRPFRPQEFYLRSSAFLRHRIQKIPPIIAPDVGTSKPVVLRPPPTSPVKPRARPSAWSPRPSVYRRVLDLASQREAIQEIVTLPEAHRAKDRKTSSSISSEDSDWEAGWWRRRVRIRTHYVRQGSDAGATDAGGSISKAVWESGVFRDLQEVAQSELLPTRVIPTTIEEVIASLQSEAQLASDQIIRELIQSILGQNYDIKVEVGDLNDGYVSSG
ncbi:putative tetratricopeptide repeat protein 6 [Sciurus carolinensis]|uniref:Tetratricopeptide repeat protein 6 n=1 Tax=Sciurus carolinensis TaxID=30640 RepID=A0AA41MD35_SCICA|nr:uncharacterized protein LOC124976576 [Sciurus carolinensis]MBZ3869644.1 putative tetratricopeptide repeat protein 6 [Sciurus carolinensis]